MIKRILVFIIIICMAFGSVSCKNEDDPENYSELSGASAEIDLIVPKPELMLDDTSSLPVFKVRNLDSDMPGRIDAYGGDGKLISTCICGSDNCSCGINARFLTWGNSICSIAETDGANTVFNVFDISDRNAPKHTAVTVEGISTETHTITAWENTPYYKAVLTSKEAEKRGEERSVIIIDMSAAARILNYPACSAGFDLLYIDNDTLYFGELGEHREIQKIYRARPNESEAELVAAFEYKDIDSFGKFSFFFGENGKMYILFACTDSESEYGFSLWQFVFSEGVEPKRILRAKNVCDYIICGNHFYYTVNDPQYSREFIDQDKGNMTYTDMSGGFIYRQSVENTEAEPSAVWSVGDYYLYGFTPKNKPVADRGDFKLSSLATFIQNPDGGLLLQANKKVGEKMIHTYLLIGNTENGVVMTELEGSGAWGYFPLSDVGGGTSCNWENRP